MKTISYEESRSLCDAVYIDVRSPREYSQDHIPGAVNIPIFDDIEHADVGTIYRMSGQEEAITHGSRIVGNKLGDIIAQIQELSKTGTLVIYCFRGGMRSSSLVSLLESLGFSPVYQMERGYKGYRRWVIRELENLPEMPPLFVLQGLTGTGKTEILYHIENSIDLEGLAGHRSSVFGGIGMKQNAQKYFESLLLKRIIELRDAPYAVIEGESKKVGNCHIPPEVFSLMRRSPAIYIEAEEQRRIGIIHDDYTRNLDINHIKEIVDSIESRIGKKHAVRLKELIEKGELREFIRLLLEKYYDPLYSYGMRSYEYIAVVENSDSKVAASQVVDTIETFLKNET